MALQGRLGELSGAFMGKKTLLTSGECHSSTAFLVVIRHVIDPGADGIMSHHAGIARVQHL